MTYGKAQFFKEYICLMHIKLNKRIMLNVHCNHNSKGKLIA